MIAPQASAQSKVDQARKEADGARASVVQQYDAAKGSVASTYNAAASKVDGATHDVAHKVGETSQSWGAWLGSWVGYGQGKADETKREGAAEIAQGAGVVKKEAEKRT